MSLRFIADENMGPTVAKWLTSKGYEVFSVYDEASGVADEYILEKANRENYIVISCDKDFGELVFKNRLPHKGVILLRLSDESAASKIFILEELLSQYSDSISGRFTVVTEKSIRIT